VYSAFQAMMSYLMIPLFCLALIGSIAATCAAVSMALANAGTYERKSAYCTAVPWSFDLI
jgi:hypothetical protein